MHIYFYGYNGPQLFCITYDNVKVDYLQIDQNSSTPVA